MPRMILKLSEGKKSWYLEWSTVVDAPVSFGMTLGQFKKFYQEEYGRSSMDELERRLERVEEKGTSSLIHASADDLISYNRAGKNETILSKQQLIDVYCIRKIAEKDKPLGTKAND